MAESPARYRSLAEFLAHSPLIAADALARAERATAEHARPLVSVLSRLGLTPERKLAEAMADALGLRIVRGEELPGQAVLAERFSAKFLRHSLVLPLSVEADRLRLAMADPFDRFARAAVGSASGLQIEPLVALPAEIEAAIDRLYGSEAPGHAAEVTGPGEELDSDADRLADLASEAPVIRLVGQIVDQAVDTGASDIHFEPRPQGLAVRMRYDGVLHEREAPPAALAPAILSRLKILAGLDIAERRLPQDGRMQLAVRGRAIDFRVSTIPMLHGESVVVRVLDGGDRPLGFEALGLKPAFVEAYRSLLHQPNGVVLVTGPTGSGKTTTLYTSLLELRSTTRKLITVEDPIEYQLPGVGQIQVKPKIDLSFARALRSILRHDPDVIMIGEIRDRETAAIAIQAALTGHLVLATLHANSAASAATRLRDMGIENFLLTATLNGVVAQRLVRRLCMACSVADPERLTLLRTLAPRLDLNDAAPRRAMGCPLCRGTGYSGRLAIAELLVMDEGVHRLVLDEADHAAIQRHATERGMATLFDDGLAAAAAGWTTVEEVVRTVRLAGAGEEIA